MKWINNALLAASACLALTSPAQAQTIPANAIESVNVARQGSDVAVRVDLKEALAAPPAALPWLPGWPAY